MQNLTAPPQAVSAADFMDGAGLHPDDLDGTGGIDALLRAAQAVVETGTSRPMGLRDVRITWAGTPCARWMFPVCPVASVASVIAASDDGAVSVDLTNAARLTRAADEPALWFPAGSFDGLAGMGWTLTVEASVGSVPAPDQAVQAVILIARDWFEAGVTLDGVESPKLTFGARSLIKQIAYRRPTVCAVA